MEAHDHNNDGLLDIIGGHESSLVGSVLLGNGDGTFRNRFDFIQGQVATGSRHDVVAKDVNGDGKLDILIANNAATDGSVSVLLGNGDGTFAAQVCYAATPGRLVVGDVNNDGCQDIVVGGSGVRYTALGNGNGTFRAATSVADATMPGSIGLADFNGDGIQDIATINNTYTGIAVYRGVGDGTFVKVATYANGGYSDIQIADFNNDGRMDIATATYTANKSVVCYLSNGDLSFQTGKELVVSTDAFEAYSISIGDMNGDGIQDIVSGGATGQARVLAGNGDGYFHQIGAGVVIGAAYRFALGDFNRDGMLDIAMGMGKVAVYLANGNASTFSPYLNLYTQDSARAALGTISHTLEHISSELGSIGAFQSRMKTAMNAMSVSRENTVAAESRIRDVDVADEAATLTRKTILQQAAAAVLAQANKEPELVMTLLRG